MTLDPNNVLCECLLYCEGDVEAAFAAAEQILASSGEPESNDAKPSSLPPLKDNYTKPLSTYSPKLYRETDPSGLLEMLPNTSMGEGSPREFHLANTPDLAIGQGKNTGV